MEDNTRIVSIKFAAGRFFVLFSGRERGIPVSEDLVHKHRLKEGITLTAPQVAQLEREAERAECERVVVRLLGTAGAFDRGTSDQIDSPEIRQRRDPYDYQRLYRKGTAR